MTGNAAGTGRSAAVRAAHEVAARRAKALQEREQVITAVLADYFEAKARSEKIRTTAQAHSGRLIEAAEHKAARLTAEAHSVSEQLTEQAEQDAADHDAQLGAAVRRLLELGESKASVAEMTGLSQAVVRAVAREHVDHPVQPPSNHPASGPRTRRHTGPPPE